MQSSFIIIMLAGALTNLLVRIHTHFSFPPCKWGEKKTPSRVTPTFRKSKLSHCIYASKYNTVLQYFY